MPDWPPDIGYINAHGTGTLANDRSETIAILARFSARHPPPVSSTKAMHGHAIGATGALEAMACILALTEGILPPTIGFQAPDPTARWTSSPTQPAVGAGRGGRCRTPLPSAG
jgi:nodulation protein E